MQFDQIGASYSSHFQARQIGTSCTESVKPRSSLTLWIRHSFAVSFDHLVGENVERRWDSKAESIGSFAVDYQLEFRRLFDRQVRWLGAFENLVDESCREPRKLSGTIAVAHEAACFRVFAIGEDGWQAGCKGEASCCRRPKNKASTATMIASPPSFIAVSNAPAIS